MCIPTLYYFKDRALRICQLYDRQCFNSHLWCIMTCTHFLHHCAQGGFPSQRVSNVELWCFHCCQYEQAVEQNWQCFKTPLELIHQPSLHGMILLSDIVTIIKWKTIYTPLVSNVGRDESVEKGDGWIFQWWMWIYWNKEIHYNYVIMCIYLSEHTGLWSWIETSSWECFFDLTSKKK